MLLCSTWPRSKSPFVLKLESKMTKKYTMYVFIHHSNSSKVPAPDEIHSFKVDIRLLRGGEWVHCLFLFPLVFRENVVVICKIGSFLYSLDNLLQKNLIVSFFGNQISKWRSFEKKKAISDLLFTFLVTREKLHKFLQHIPHSHTFLYFAHPIDFFALPILKKNTNLSG